MYILKATILKDDLAGFTFESNRNTRHTFSAETCLSPDISAGWGAKRKLQSKIEVLKLKVSGYSVLFDNLAFLLHCSCCLSVHVHVVNYVKCVVVMATDYFVGKEAGHRHI